MIVGRREGGVIEGGREGGCEGGNGGREMTAVC